MKKEVMNFAITRALCYFEKSGIALTDEEKRQIEARKHSIIFWHASQFPAYVVKRHNLTALQLLIFY